MRIERVENRSDLDDFARMPGLIHPRDLYAPLLDSTLRSWWTGSSPHPGRIDLIVARDGDGDVVARTTVHTDARLDERLGGRHLLFGATEFADPESGTYLLEHIQEEARQRGLPDVFGPVSLLPNQAGGVITSGFGDRGFIDSAWNPSWAPEVYEDAGFQRWGEADTWLVETGSANAVAPNDAEWAQAGIALEYGHPSRMNELLPELLGVLNAAFEALPYYTQITPEELDAATDGLSHLLDERLLLLGREAGTRELIAFILTVPDITEFVQEIDGKLGPLAGLRLLATRKRYRKDAILIIQGTRPDRQGRGILTLLSRQLQANLAEAGYRRLRSTYVGRDNPASTAQFRRFGGRPLHGYTFYRKTLERGTTT